MIDNASILLACGAIVLVVWRAVILDARQSWFAPHPRPAKRRRES